MEKELSFMTYVNEKKKDKRVEEFIEDILGIPMKTKLEKLADSFSNVKYQVHPDNENPDLGWIEFAHRRKYYFNKEESEIKEIAERFYNKEDYIIIATTFDNGFSIDILNNFIKKTFNEIMKK